MDFNQTKPIDEKIMKNSPANILIIRQVRVVILQNMLSKFMKEFIIPVTSVATQQPD